MPLWVLRHDPLLELGRPCLVDLGSDTAFLDKVTCIHLPTLSPCAFYCALSRWAGGFSRSRKGGASGGLVCLENVESNNVPCVPNFEMLHPKLTGRLAGRHAASRTLKSCSFPPGIMIYHQSTIPPGCIGRLSWEIYPTYTPKFLIPGYPNIPTHSPNKSPQSGIPKGGCFQRKDSGRKRVESDDWCEGTAGVPSCHCLPVPLSPPRFRTYH